MQYRSDIDGLRAVAVMLVVLYHARIPSITGGFIGVDVFFVISGYLITSIIADQVRQGNFSILRFYDRRIRRILPALLTVLAITTAGATAFFTPTDFVAFANSLKATAAFYSNIWFYQEAGYFAPASETMPLLHTWSLAVEEQFYIVAPFLLVLLGRFGPVTTRVIVTLLLLASLAVSQSGVAGESEAAFYLPHARAFELLVGMLLALSANLWPTGTLACQAAGIIGAGLIAVPAFAYDSNTPFPGIAALPPTLGAALIIGAGLSRKTVAAQLLSLPPMVWIGLRSYSIYLWHWPLLALASYRLGDDLTLSGRLLLVVLAIVLSDVTYRFVEQPARHGFRRWTPTRSVLAAATAIAIITLVSFGIVWSGGLPGRLPQSVADFEQQQAREAMPKPCLAKARALARLDCVIGAPGATRTTFLVWGDSHADMLLSAVSRAANDSGRKGVAAIRVSCAPLFVTEREGGPFARGKCIDLAEKVEEALQTSDITDVILIARWAKYVEGTEMLAGELVHNHFFEGNESENRARFARLLTQTIARITATGRRVTLVGPVPELRENLPNAITRAMMKGTSVNLDVPRASFDERNAFVSRMLSDAAAMPGVRLVNLHQNLCNDDVCAATRNGRPLFGDDNHLSKAGSEAVLPSIRQTMTPVGPTDATRAGSD